MPHESEREAAATAMRHINQAWVRGRVDDLGLLVHPDIVMVLPGFSGRIQGREAILAGFRDFCETATIHDFREHEEQIDVAGRTAVVSFRYELTYERSGQRYRATGRDLWVFQNEGREWIAVWRTMLELEEHDA
jgi:ketosteroid isomerase-like protein